MCAAVFERRQPDLSLQRHLIFSHVLSFICLSHNDPTVLDQDEWEPS
jgi:hypothetical protein